MISIDNNQPLESWSCRSVHILGFNNHQQPYIECRYKKEHLGHLLDWQNRKHRGPTTQTMLLSLVGPCPSHGWWEDTKGPAIQQTFFWEENEWLTTSNCLIWKQLWFQQWWNNSAYSSSGKACLQKRWLGTGLRWCVSPMYQRLTFPRSSIWERRQLLVKCQWFILCVCASYDRGSHSHHCAEQTSQINNFSQPASVRFSCWE